MGTSHRGEDRLSLLYEASCRGCVSTLNSLLQREPLILHKISKSAFAETPLHISALLGHLEFTKALLSYKPKLALELDTSRSTALHLASAEGHIHIVKELLKVNKQPCLFPDEEGRIPLHYAAMRGRIEVVKELINAKPESLSFRENGKTVFHLCVTYNHLETLKALVDLELAMTGEIHNFRSSDGTGNSVLHLAVMLKQVETVRYLLEVPKTWEVASLKNEMGFTAHEIVELSAKKDLKVLEIELMLMNAGIKTEKKGIDTHLHNTSNILDHPVAARPRKHNCVLRVLKWIGNWFKHKGDWLEEMRGNLSLVSTVISTITFQSIVNPPGGFIQQGLSGNTAPSSSNDSLNCTILSNNQTYCPGLAVSFFTYPTEFQTYVICNTISFFSSLSVTLLLVSGVPMRNKVVIWILSICMCITLTTLAFAYIAALAMMTPEHLRLTQPTLTTVGASLIDWAGLIMLIVVYITLRFLIWIVKKCVRAIKKISRCARNEN